MNAKKQNLRKLLIYINQIVFLIFALHKFYFKISLLQV